MGRYRRTVSFPNPIPSFTPNNSNPNRHPKSYHVRSVSLPCGRTHPLIPQLRDEINELRTWTWAGSAQMVTGLARLKSVLDSLDDVLQLPQTQDSLQNDIVERLLEDFLRFVDAYEVFHGALLGLRQEVSSAQVAIRRKDDSKLGIYVKAHKKFANDVAKLVGSLSERSDEVVKSDDEIYMVVRDACRLTASITEAIFGGMSGSFGSGRRPIWAGLGLGLRKAKKEEEGLDQFGKVLRGIESLLEFRKRKSYNNNNNDSNREEVKMGVLKGMQEMEGCVGEMERESEKVFRSLISNRVSLLNILTHA